MVSSDGFKKVFEKIKNSYPDKSLIFTYCHGADTVNGSSIGYINVKMPANITPEVMSGKEESLSLIYISIPNNEDLTVNDATDQIMRQLEKEFRRIGKAQRKGRKR